MIALICFVLAVLASPFKSKSWLEAENSVLRHQYGFAERLIRSIRRECLHHIIVWGEGHLRRNLISYAAYYNSVRTHRSLRKDAPIFPPIQQIGIIRSHPILGGLHHNHVRV